MSPQGPPQYAALLFEGARYETIEFSAAGVSFARSTVEATVLSTFRRGGECEGTLCLGGTGWEEEYAVVLRLATHGPTHLGFAFSTLPPAARRLLGTAVPEDVPAGASPWGGRPAPFAFARLLEREAPARRFVLPVSKSVFALTEPRHQKNGRCRFDRAVREPAPRPTALPAPADGAAMQEPASVSPGAWCVYGAAFLVTVMVFWAVVVG